MNATHRPSNENYMDRIVSAIHNADWKKIAKYAVSAGAGAAALGFAGHEYGRDIADLVVESKMGMERAIAGDLIAKISPYAGGLGGMLAAYVSGKIRKKQPVSQF